MKYKTQYIIMSLKAKSPSTLFLVPTACTLPIVLIVIGPVFLLLAIVLTIFLTVIAARCSECKLCRYMYSFMYVISFVYW